MPGFVANNTITFRRRAIVSDADPAPQNPVSVVQDSHDNALADLDCQIIPGGASNSMRVARPDVVVTHHILLEEDVSAVRNGDVGIDGNGRSYSVEHVEDIGGMGMLYRVYVKALG